MITFIYCKCSVWEKDAVLFQAYSHSKIDRGEEEGSGHRTPQSWTIRGTLRKMEGGNVVKLLFSSFIYLPLTYFPNNTYFYFLDVHLPHCYLQEGLWGNIRCNVTVTPPHPTPPPQEPVASVTVTHLINVVSNALLLGANCPLCCRSLIVKSLV